MRPLLMAKESKKSTKSQNNWSRLERGDSLCGTNTNIKDTRMLYSIHHAVLGYVD